MNTYEQDLALSREIARRVADAGGRAMYVGGMVRDSLTGTPCKDIDLEVYGLTPTALRDVLAGLGEVSAYGASFGVYGLRHSAIDIAMPRRERCVGIKHTDFEVSVDPDMSFEDATRRRDLTINAMMRDALTGDLIDLWGGQRDLADRVVRHVSDETFPEDALRVFRAAQFAARLESTVAPETMALCRRMDVSDISHERVFDELCKALLKAKKPSVFFRVLLEMDHLKEFFPELQACAGVRQNPVYHPEGDVFEHTLLVLDSAAALRERAQWPLAFMLSALFHDLGKAVATQVQPDGKITAYGHEVQGLPLCEAALRRLTSQAKLIEYVKNMMWLHMRPNMLAAARSKKKKTRQLFDLSVCPEDLILLSRADATGKLDAPYDEANEAFLRERLDDYREVMKRPMVTGRDLIDAGLRPGPAFSKRLARARELHFAGLEKERALKQVLAEARHGE
ncbi:MAG: tRNA nucleotidyltransferase [Clostridia bacterium]|nr:tRNA nucleotidyltransferase [Clostridia bacterium]